jgi:hypothetical protein
MLVRRDRPLVAERVFQAAVAITPEHVGDRHGHARTGGDGLAYSRVDIGDVKVEVTVSP